VSELGDDPFSTGEGVNHRIGSARRKSCSHQGLRRTERIDQLSLLYTKEELTALAESFLRDFPFGELPYLMEHVRQHVGDRLRAKRLRVRARPDPRRPGADAYR
jgi:hypothetical protein